MTVAETGSIKELRRVINYNSIIQRYYMLDVNEHKEFPDHRKARFPYLGMVYFPLDFDGKIIIGQDDSRKGFISNEQAMMWNIKKRILTSDEVSIIKAIITIGYTYHLKRNISGAKYQLLKLWDYICGLQI